jgi:Ca2+-binding RTX toxin-like protein
VSLLYQNVLGRDADAQGLTNWTARLDGGMTRAEVVIGFSESLEYRRGTAADLDAFMRIANVSWTDVLEGGAGDDAMNGGIGSDLFIFRQGAGGSDVIHGFEPWDALQLSRFGYANGVEARARMTQVGPDVVFSDQGQTIRFTDMSITEMARVTFNVS